MIVLHLPAPHYDDHARCGAAWPMRSRRNGKWKWCERCKEKLHR